ncbi:MAG: hypothetical protein ABIZ49_06910 [Opitutaceae bacterium]
MNTDKELNRNLKKDKSRNPDPITGAPGSHPVGTGVGAAIGGAAATGALAGTVAGPAGTIAGAAVGAVIGGLVGKGVAEKIDPTREDAYWRENHSRQGWAQGRAYEEFGPAYRTGYEGYGEFGVAGKTFEESEAELQSRYESESPVMSWEEARPASRAAWEKFNRENLPESSVDTYGNPRKK